MTDLINRPGFRVVAEIPAGAKIKQIWCGIEPAWIVAPADQAPYILKMDGTTVQINPVFTDAQPSPPRRPGRWGDG